MARQGGAQDDHREVGVARFGPFSFGAGNCKGGDDEVGWLVRSRRGWGGPTSPSLAKPRCRTQKEWIDGDR